MVTLLANLHARKQKLPVQQTAWYPKKLPTFSDALALVKETLFMQHYFPTSLFHTNIRKPQRNSLRFTTFLALFTLFRLYHLDKV